MAIRPDGIPLFTQIVPGPGAGADCVAGANRLPDDAGPVYKVLGMETDPVKTEVRAL